MHRNYASGITLDQFYFFQLFGVPAVLITNNLNISQHAGILRTEGVMLSLGSLGCNAVMAGKVPKLLGSLASSHAKYVQHQEWQKV